VVGYHYTSLENYRRIQHEGLKLYPLRKEFHQWVTQGIWLYTEQQDRLSHLGCVAWQCRTKGTKDVVLLQVKYIYKDRVTPDGKHTFTVKHDLFDKYPTKIFLHRQASATVIFRPVPSNRVKLLCTTSVGGDLDYFIEELRKAA